MRAVTFFFGYVPLGILLANCGAEPLDIPEPEPPRQNPTGGTGSGGTSGFGGTQSTSGTTGVSGSFSQSGTQSTAGTNGQAGTGVAGNIGAGGTVAGTGGTTGGTAPIGGTTPVGGTSAAGTSSVAGTAPTAGTGTTAGSAGTGAGEVVCGAAFDVTSDGFVRAPGSSGCWHGYASAGGDTGSTVAPKMFNSCGEGCMIKASGTVGPANADNDYVGSIYIGFNVNQGSGSSSRGTVTPTGTGLNVVFTNTGGSATVRVQISAGNTRWCALATSGTTIPYTTFNTACWDDSGTAYGKQAIDTVQLVIPGVEEESPFDITLVSVKDT